MSQLLQSRLSRRAGLGIAAAALATTLTSRAVFADGTPSVTTDCACGSTVPAQTLAQSATPSASPVALETLPPGPLGDRIQWLLDLINGDPAQITADAIATEFTEEFLVVVPAEEVAAVLTEIADKAGPLTMQPDQLATNLEEPPTTAVFRTDGRDGVVVQITLIVDTTSGQISGLVLTPLGFTLDEPMTATPAA